MDSTIDSEGDNTPAPTTASTVGAYSVRTLAERLGVSEKSVYSWHLARRLPGALKIGKAVRFDKPTIEKRLLSGSLLLPVGRAR